MSDSGSDAPKTAMQIAASLAGDVYKDGVQPSVQTIGQALNGIFKAVSHYPRLWGMMSEVSLEEKERQFKEKLQAKVDAIPNDKKVLPKPNILGPSVQALEYGIFEDHLSEMFANLISGAMNSDASNTVHPSFVDIIKQMTRNEALVLKFMADTRSIHAIVDVVDEKGRYVVRNFFGPLSKVVEDPKETHAYLDNLLRLRLIDLDINDQLWQNHRFEEDYVPWFETFKETMRARGEMPDAFSMRRKVVFLSEYGKNFVKVCIEPSSFKEKE